MRFKESCKRRVTFRERLWLRPKEQFRDSASISLRESMRCGRTVEGTVRTRDGNQARVGLKKTEFSLASAVCF